MHSAQYRSKFGLSKLTLTLLSDLRIEFCQKFTHPSDHKVLCFSIVLWLGSKCLYKTCPPPKPQYHFIFCHFSWFKERYEVLQKSSLVGCQNQLCYPICWRMKPVSKLCQPCSQTHLTTTSARGSQQHTRSTCLIQTTGLVCCSHPVVDILSRQLAQELPTQGHPW